MVHSNLTLFILLVFQNRLHQAKMSVQDRNSKVAGVIESLERDMDLLCLTGVEDKLQENVRPTLELLRNAGIKVSWMLIVAKWKHRSLSTLAQAMAWCPTASSHYLNQCWLLISEFLWQSSQSNFAVSAQTTILCNENCTFKIAASSPIEIIS